MNVNKERVLARVEKMIRESDHVTPAIIRELMRKAVRAEMKLISRS